MYQAMQDDRCVVKSPKEYVEMAVRLGTDKEYRRAVGGGLGKVWGAV